MKEEIKSIIKDFHQRGIPKFKERNFDIPLDTQKVISLVGSRRSGKTYLFYQIIQKLLKKMNIQNILYFNFEDERLSFEKNDFQLILDSYQELYPQTNLENVYFFFDEIQEFDGWEKFIRRIHETISKNIFVTGSSAKLLSKEIATSLRGRTITYEVFPLSFKEFLSFNEVDDKDFYSTKNKALINNLFNKYLELGGYPEVYHFEKNLKNKILQNYFDVMIYRDIIERYDLKSPEVLKLFVKKLLTNISKEFSLHKTYNEVKSLGAKISKDLLYKFPNYLEDIYMFFFIKKYEESLQKQELSPKKIYSIDTGFSNSLSFRFSDDMGRVLENLVFLELRRNFESIYYFKEKGECDFIIKEGIDITHAIQVTDKMDSEKTRKREFDGLLDAIEKFDLKQGLILTQDEEGEEIINSKKIIIKPVWKWLLEK